MKKIVRRPAHGSVKKDKVNNPQNSTLKVHVGYARWAADKVSGDSALSCTLWRVSETGNKLCSGRALILSDGMGKGAEAAAESGAVVKRLKRNLKKHMPAAQAIKEVNRFIIENELMSDCCESENDFNEPVDRETFATVDLILLDGKLGKVKFYKMGAAPSFLVRGQKVRRIEQPALPVGIIPRLKLTHISTVLMPGDIIIMVSDGITEADRSDYNAQWLTELLVSVAKTEKKPGPRQLAERILAAADCRYEGSEKDDATVVVAIVE